MTLDAILTVTFTLFAVIDIIGSIPLLLSLKQKMGGIQEMKASLISGALMIFFLVKSFAVGGAIVIFILGLEMVLGIEFFKGDGDSKSGTVVPIAFPLIAGSGTLTTIISLRSSYDEWIIAIGILINVLIVYLVLHSLDFISKLLGHSGMIAIRKFFGVILLAIAVKIFAANVGGLIR